MASVKMAVSKRNGSNGRLSFAKSPEIISIPSLIEIQRRSFEQFLQKDVTPEQREEIGLQGIFIRQDSNFARIMVFRKEVLAHAPS